MFLIFIGVGGYCGYLKLGRLLFTVIVSGMGLPLNCPPTSLFGEFLSAPINFSKFQFYPCLFCRVSEQDFRKIKFAFQKELSESYLGGVCYVLECVFGKFNFLCRKGLFRIHLGGVCVVLWNVYSEA